jgi:lysozyme
MNVNNALKLAVGLVFPSEGFSAKSYLDTLTKPPRWTIGHGTTLVHGRPVTEGMSCTREAADAWAAEDMRSAAFQVVGIVRVKLNDCQLAALTSLVYNIGIGHFGESSVLEALNLALYSVAADRFLEYDEAGGRVITGLQTRRARERAMFLTGMPANPIEEPTESEADKLNDAEIIRIATPPSA